jgi:hypothetical protein
VPFALTGNFVAEAVADALSRVRYSEGVVYLHRAKKTKREKWGWCFYLSFLSCRQDGE